MTRTYKTSGSCRASKTLRASRSADERGFMAVTAVLLLASGALAFSLATMSAAALYADSVMKDELRIQAGFNAEACLDSVKLMAEKNYFISGTIVIRDFDCKAEIQNDLNGHVSIAVKAQASGVTARDSGSLTLIF